MIAHPLLWAIVAVDGMSCLLICTAGISALRILLYWEKDSSSSRQLRLERLGESARSAMRLGLFFSLTAVLLFIAAIASVLPSIVPGAMCGTGVLKSMGAAGAHALWSRGVVIALLLLWRLLSRLDASEPLSPLTSTLARLSLLSAPAAIVALYHLLQAISAIDPHTPVDCCATVYAAAAVSLSPVRSVSSVALSTGTATLAAALGATALAANRAPGRHRIIRFVAPLSILFAIVAGCALVYVFASYHYGVLAHYCPWCLFLGEHRYVGWPLYLALFVVLAEGCAVFTANAIGRRHPTLGEAAARRVKTGTLRLLAGLLLFLALTFGAALLWRLRFGVWVSG
jgi:hypothetical protein